MRLGCWGTEQTQETALQGREQGYYHGVPQTNTGGVKPALHQEIFHKVRWFDA